jgi:hypothetical protein
VQFPVVRVLFIDELDVPDCEDKFPFGIGQFGKGVAKLPQDIVVELLA